MKLIIEKDKKKIITLVDRDVYCRVAVDKLNVFSLSVVLNEMFKVLEHHYSKKDEIELNGIKVEYIPPTEESASSNKK